MTKEEKNEVLFSLDHILKYIKRSSDSEYFDPSHCIMHLKPVMKILKKEESEKEKIKKNSN